LCNKETIVHLKPNDHQATREHTNAKRQHLQVNQISLFKLASHGSKPIDAQPKAGPANKSSPASAGQYDKCLDTNQRQAFSWPPLFAHTSLQERKQQWREYAAVACGDISRTVKANGEHLSQADTE